MDRTQLILQIVLIALQELPSLIYNIYKMFEKDDVTLEDIEKIRQLVRDPEEYFKKKIASESS
ncbi:MAG: hypothetical protein QXT73_00665 [Candidatus Methanomethylicaceae archaeon]